MPDHFVNKTNRFNLKHMIKLWAVGVCGRDSIENEFEYTQEMHNLIDCHVWRAEVMADLDDSPLKFNIDSLVDGGSYLIEELESYAESKCEKLMSDYDGLILELNKKLDAKLYPNKIPKRH